MGQSAQKKRHPEAAYIPTNFLLCRNAHHHQFEAKAVYVEVDEDDQEFYRGEFLCRVCGLPKTEWVNPETGERLGTPAYGYSALPGYLFDAPVEDRKAFNLEIRKEMFWRWAYNGKAKKRGT